MTGRRSPLVGDASPAGEERPESISQPAPTHPAIHVRELTRTFGDHRVLSNVDLAVGAGEVHALLGPNGAGKTTLLRVIVGSVRPDHGEVEVMGVPWSELSRPRSRSLFGLVTSGDRSSYHRLSGLENLRFFGRLYGLPPRQARQRALEALEMVGLSDAAKVRSGHYSHGMQKRLAMARAMLMDPPVLLIDEATHDLDPAGARTVRQMMSHAAERGAAVLWATQRVDEIRDTAHRVSVIDRGEVRFQGTVEQLSRTARGRTYRLEVAPEAETLPPGAFDLEPLPAPGTYRVALAEGVHIGEVVAGLEESGIAVIGCHHERSEIEEAFLALTEPEEPGE